jgi:hypothetical protein
LALAKNKCTKLTVLQTCCTSDGKLKYLFLIAVGFSQRNKKVFGNSALAEHNLIIAQLALAKIFTEATAGALIIANE